MLRLSLQKSVSLAFLSLLIAIIGRHDQELEERERVLSEAAGSPAEGSRPPQAPSNLHRDHQHHHRGHGKHHEHARPERVLPYQVSFDGWPGQALSCAEQ